MDKSAGVRGVCRSWEWCEEGREPDKAQQSGLRNVKAEGIFIEVNILLGSVSCFPSQPQGHIFDLHTQQNWPAEKEGENREGGRGKKEGEGREEMHFCVIEGKGSRESVSTADGRVNWCNFL